MAFRPELSDQFQYSMRQYMVSGAAAAAAALRVQQQYHGCGQSQ